MGRGRGAGGMRGGDEGAMGEEDAGVRGGRLRARVGSGDEEAVSRFVVAVFRSCVTLLQLSENVDESIKSARLVIVSPSKPP